MNRSPWAGLPAEFFEHVPFYRRIPGKFVTFEPPRDAAGVPAHVVELNTKYGPIEQHGHLFNGKGGFIVVYAHYSDPITVDDLEEMRVMVRRAESGSP